MKRSSGIIARLQDLPPKGVCGSLGSTAYAFIDFLKASGQSWWEIPCIPPVSSDGIRTASAFAGDVSFIDLELVLEDGLIDVSELEDLKGSISSGEDFALKRLGLLKNAFVSGKAKYRDAFNSFIHSNEDWLTDFSLFSALQDRFHENTVTYSRDSFENFKTEKFNSIPAEWKDAAEFYAFLQFLFLQQWERLRSYAHEKGISLIGSADQALSHDAADAGQSGPFHTDGSGMECGQPALQASKADKFQYTHHWWLSRIKTALERFDCVKLKFCSLPLTSLNGGSTDERALKADREFLSELKKLGAGFRIILDDAGADTPEMRKIITDLGFPAARYLEEGFQRMDPSCRDLPHNYVPQTAAYLGKADALPAEDWVYSAAPEAVGFAVDYLNLSEREGYHWGMLRGLYASPALLAMTRLDDLPERNLPFSYEDFDADRLRYYAELYGRSVRRPAKKRH